MAGGWRVFLLVPTGPKGPGALGGRVVEVGFADKFSNRVQELRGRMKRNAGSVTTSIRW